MAKAKAKLAKQHLGKIGRVQIFSPDSVRRTNNILTGLNTWAGKLLGEKFSFLVRNFEEHAELLSLIDGFPTGLALKGCYWRNRSKAWRPHSDPIEDQCGFRWLSPTLPMKGEAIHEMLTIARSYYARHGFEFAATLTVVTTETCQGALSIYFDAENQEERRRANRLAAALKQKFHLKGWLSYRLPNDEMTQDINYAHPNVIVLRKRIKEAFDKKAILSPGRYASRSAPDRQ